MKNKRSIISLLIGLCVLVIAVTSVMMFIQRHSNTTAAVHTTIGFLFLCFIAFHIINNWTPLKNYSTSKGKLMISSVLIFAVLTIGLITYGVYSETAPFRYIYDLGSGIRAQQSEIQDSLAVKYDVISTKTEIAGRSIKIEVTKGKEDYHSVMTIWVEDDQGNYIETLYATKNIATGEFWQEVDGEDVRISVRRPEAVPYWSHKRGVKESDDFMVPTPKTRLVDGITGATPPSHYVLNSSISATNLKRFKILYEVNRSFDWNEYYNENAFPDDPIYSGNGYVGQPSLIYSTPIIEVNDKRSIFLMNVIGHGHHSGADGELYPDLSNVTSALDITDRILVIVN